MRIYSMNYKYIANIRNIKYYYKLAIFEELAIF